MGLDSPLATPVALFATLALLAAALVHVKNLRGWVDEKTERRLTGLRLLGAILLGVLLLRPYWSEETPGSGLFRVVALADHYDRHSVLYRGPIPLPGVATDAGHG